MIVEHSETLTHAHDPAHPLEEKIYYYLDAPKSSLRHGRRYQEVVKRNKLETTTQYQFNSLLDPLGGHQVLETRKTLFGYDGAQRSTVQRRSLLHGEKLYELNENGVHTQWAYDALRRVTEERVSPETPFEAKNATTTNSVPAMPTLPAPESPTLAASPPKPSWTASDGRPGEP